MQDIQPIAGGRIFGGGGSGGTGDRRLRPHHHPSGGGGHLQALKCPRCDSLNTKFCYYNNYNLSQPRHFCKNCRRYWTKGGVLRNVPIGGGCRKTKRSKPKPSASAEPAQTAETAATTEAPQEGRDHRKTSSHSSSESSSLTATTTAAAGEAVSATSSISPTSFFNVHDYKSVIANTMSAPPPSNPRFDQALLEQSSSGSGLFSDIGNFTSLIASSSAEQLPFGFSSVLDQNTNHWSQQQQIERGGEIPSSHTGAFLDQTTVQVDLPAWQGRPPTGSQAFGPLDWQPAAEQGLFDLPSTADQAYWGHHQSSHWADDVHHQPGLYLP